MLSERSHTQKAVFCMGAFVDVQDLCKDTGNSGFQELGVRGGVECMRNRRVLGAMELLCLWLWWLHDCICENSQNHSPKSVRFACVVVVQLLSCIWLFVTPLSLQHTRLPCPLLSPRVSSNSCPSSWWCHPTTSSSAAPFSSCPQSFPASGSFPESWLFASGGQSIGASASVLPMDIQGWFPLRFTYVNYT